MKTLLTLILMAFTMTAHGQSMKITYVKTPNVEYQLRNEKRKEVRERVTKTLLANQKYYALIHTGTTSEFKLDRSRTKSASTGYSLSNIESCTKDLAQKKMYMTILFDGLREYVEDDLLLYQTERKEETKIIAGKKCYKVNATFKYEDYVFWVTDEVGINNGPFQFHTAQGCILQVDAKAYSLIAQEIDASEDFKEVKIKSKGKGAMTFEAYRDKLEKAINSVFLNDMMKN